VDWFGDRAAVVTGAAHGIGRAIAEQLRALGARVVAVDIDTDALGDFELSYPADLSSDGTEDLGRELDDRFGPVELLVNNVGTLTPHTFADLDQAGFDRVIRTNLRGPWFLTRAITERMVERKSGGAVLFVSSLHDHVPLHRPHYSASKAAVSMLVRELANELGPHGIRVNAVSPGAIATRLTDEQALQKLQRHFPLGRHGRPDDVARIAAVLLSDEWSGYVTGANVPVDGGLDLITWA
jgi:NAD(P)-dependent dehydrogenase (short-subunit alcohol dehydrogenase family)